MDPNELRHLDFFTVPNNQTVNPADQTFNLTGATPNQPSSIWDNVASGSPSRAPTSLSLEPLAQSSSSTAATHLSINPSSSARSSMYSQSRQILPTRAPRAREGHERKRSRLSTDATPFDSVDYWIQFDDEEPLADSPESTEVTRSDSALTGNQPPMQRSMNQTRTSDPAAIQNASGFGKPVEYMDDSALDNALSDDDGEGFSSINLAEHLSKIDSAPPIDIPPREGLYSTPLSWERPQPGLRMDSLIGLNSPALNEAEQRRLIAIAMNPGPRMGGLGSNLMNFGGLNPGLDTDLGSGFRTTSADKITNAPPQPKSPTQPRSIASTQPKKQNSATSEKGKDKAKHGDRTAHNDIERKYRTNLKDKIAELRSVVPSLQAMPETGADDEDLSQPGRAPKVSKGTVLTKATEYIHYLERRNSQITTEHQELSKRLQAFEQLLSATAQPAFLMPTYSRTLFDPRAFC